MRDKISKLINVYKKYGFLGFIKKCYTYLVINFFDRINVKVLFKRKKYKEQLIKILKENKYDRVILWRSSFGYNVPLFQRPQHIANNLSRQKCLMFYEVMPTSDKVNTFKKQSDNLYLFNFNNIFLRKLLSEVLSDINTSKYIQLYSTDWKLTVEDIKQYINNGYKLIYEYVDDLSPEIAGTKELPKNIVDKYNYVMSNRDVYIIVTAENLKNDVISKRGKRNLAFSSNGVDYKFFKTIDKNYELDDEFNKILENKKPIVCYYGALAKWFDYELVKKIDALDKYNIVLFGIKYDESFDESGIGNLKNVYFLGSRDYQILKNYASKCDILTIPFIINSITEATSPVKIFEYMALHKPIVITDLKECRQYKSVMIGHDHEEFIKLLDSAMNKRNDKKYIELLDKEAKENDWSTKAKAIIDLVERDEKK